MKLLAIHPSGLMYTRVFLTLEPLGLELIAGAARAAGHEVRIVDLQVERPRRLWRLTDQWRPDAVCLGGNYLANVPEIIDTAKAIKTRLPGCFVFVGGHSASFVAADLLAHGGGAIDCVIKGEGEASVPLLLRALQNNKPLTTVPGAISAAGEGPPPTFIESLDTIRPARDLLTRRRRYFIGTLDPCASIEFARGCPWDCTFCSAWTFYGRSYRVASPEVIAEELARVREPGVFIVDDVAFVHARHGFEIGEAIRRRGIRKQYYLETRGDVLLRNLEVFRFWRDLGLKIMFIGLEAIDEEGLRHFRKRINLDRNMEALEAARSPHLDRHQPDRRPVMGSGALRNDSAVVRGNSRDRESQRHDALPRHRDLADRAAQAGATTGCSTSSTPCCRPHCPCRSSTPNW
jgi:hopanoid C-3 methylase HpnR